MFWVKLQSSNKATLIMYQDCKRGLQYDEFLMFILKIFHIETESIIVGAALYWVKLKVSCFPLEIEGTTA